MTEEPPGGDQADDGTGRALEVLGHLAPGTPIRALLAAVADTAGRASAAADGPEGPFLSVLVRTQGRRRATLVETLLSLAAQDSDDFEVLLLAHDVAPDGRAALEALVGEFHPSFSRRVRVVPVHGGGRSRPLNAGAAVAAGRYLAVLDDDDLAFAGWVSGFAAAAGRAPGHVVRTSVAVQVAAARPGAWDEQDGYEVTTAPALDYPPRFDFLDHVDDNRTPINGYAVPRVLVTALGQGWDESLPVLEDWDLLLRAASLCGVEDTATVGALLRSWADSASSKTEHDPVMWRTTHGRVIDKRDRLPLLLGRGAMSRLEKLTKAAVRARLANREVVQLARELRLAQEALARTTQEATALHAQLADTRERIDELLASTTWRVMEGPRRLSAAGRRLRGTLRGAPVAPSGPRPDVAPPHPVDHTDPVAYRDWVARFDTYDKEALARLRARLAALSPGPRISVVMPVHDPDPAHLRAALASVRSQLYRDWELCIADDGSTDPAVASLLRRAARRDGRVKVVRRPEAGHISAATNSALALASGDWVAFLDHDDVLPPHALAAMALAVDGHPGAGVCYSDEDKLDAEGLRHSPYFKPEFDPRLLVGQNYLTHLLLVRRDLVAGVGGLRVGLEGAQDWDLVLRVTERLEPDQVVHVPHVLYHWRAHAASTAEAGSAKPYAADAGRRAVAGHLERTASPGEVEREPASGHVRVRWPLPDPAPRVSIVVPTRDGRLLEQCVESVLGVTDYPDFEVVVVDNDSRDPAVLDYLEARQGDRMRVRHDPRPFNYSALNNEAVAGCQGAMVCLLNDDTQIVDPRWLGELVREVSRPGVGAAGAKLLYENGTIQHAGVVLGIGDVAGHAYRGWPSSSLGYMGRLKLAQTMSAVTGACMLVRRQAWDEVGGLDERDLAVAFNDVDFCLRLGRAGWRVVWTPYAELFHLESLSRGSELLREREFAREIDVMKRRWSRALVSDPAYNPNLTLVYEDWSLAWPPRVSLVDDAPPADGAGLPD